MVSESLELSNNLKTKRLSAHVLQERNLVQTSPHSTLFSPNWVEVSECHPNFLQQSSTTSVLSAQAELSAWRDHTASLFTTSPQQTQLESVASRLTRLPRWPFRCTDSTLVFPTHKETTPLSAWLPTSLEASPVWVNYFFFFFFLLRMNQDIVITTHLLYKIKLRGN